MIIAVTNLKGGVGKSTISRNLAAYFADNGVKVCIVDTDLEQRTTCDWLERRDENNQSIAVFPMTIIIDGVPQLDQVATRTILIADLLLVPITPSIDDLKSFERFLNRLEDVKVHRDTIPAFVLLNKYGGRSNEDKEVKEALDLFAEFGVTPLKATLGDRVAHRRASKYGLTAYEWEDAKAKEEIVELCEELSAIIENLPQS
jgi:chromosome partitioning protein